MLNLKPHISIADVVNCVRQPPSWSLTFLTPSEKSVMFKQGLCHIQSCPRVRVISFCMKNSVRSEVLPSVTTPLYQSPLRNVQWFWCCCFTGEVVFTNDRHSYPLPCTNGFCIVSVMSVGLSTSRTSC